VEDLTVSKSILKNKNESSPIKSTRENGSGSVTNKTTESPRTQKDDDTTEMHESTMLRKKMNRPARDEQSLQNLFESTQTNNLMTNGKPDINRIKDRILNTQ